MTVICDCGHSIEPLPAVIEKYKKAPGPVFCQICGRELTEKWQKAIGFVEKGIPARFYD